MTSANTWDVTNSKGETSSMGTRYYINASHGHGMSINSTGGDTAHNNMSPYVVVFRWRRTA